MFARKTELESNMQRALVLFPRPHYVLLLPEGLDLGTKYTLANQNEDATLQKQAGSIALNVLVELCLSLWSNVCSCNCIGTHI